MKKLFPFLAAILLGSAVLVGQSSGPVTSNNTNDTNTNDNNSNRAVQLNDDVAQSWSNLQTAMKADTLNTSDSQNRSDSVQSSCQDLLNAQVAVWNYERAVDMNDAWYSNNNNFHHAVVFPSIDVDTFTLSTELSNSDFSNPMTTCVLSKEFSDAWGHLIAFKSGALLTNLQPLQSSFDFKKYNRAQLNAAIKDVQLTDDESAAFEQFKKTLSSNYHTARKSYRADHPKLSSNATDALELQNEIAQDEDDDAILGTFSILEQSCLYEYLHLLLTKRTASNNDPVAFNNLQNKLTQSASAMDVNNSAALLDMQMDMIYYENSVHGTPQN